MSDKGCSIGKQSDRGGQTMEHSGGPAWLTPTLEQEVIQTLSHGLKHSPPRPQPVKADPALLWEALHPVYKLLLPIFREAHQAAMQEAPSTKPS